MQDMYDDWKPTRAGYEGAKWSEGAVSMTGTLGQK